MQRLVVLLVDEDESYEIPCINDGVIRAHYGVMFSRFYFLRTSTAYVNALTSAFCAIYARMVAGAVIFVPHENNMSDADWRAFALKQFVQTSMIVLGACAFIFPFNALLHKGDCNFQKRDGKDTLAVALILSVIFLLAGILGAAVGSYHVYVAKPPYFD